MKYILLIYSQDGVWSPDELVRARDEYVKLCHELNGQGQYLGAAPLYPAANATCVTVRNGASSVVDGPYAETKEQLAGYFLIDVDNLDQAISIAASIPGTTRGITEIRPIVELAGLP